MNVLVDRGVNCGFDDKKVCSDILSGFKPRGMMVGVCKLDEQVEYRKLWNTKPATFSSTITITTKPADEAAGLDLDGWIAVTGIACSGLRIMRLPGGAIAHARKSSVLTHLRAPASLW